MIPQWASGADGVCLWGFVYSRRLGRRRVRDRAVGDSGKGGDDEAEGRICRCIRSLLRRDGVWPARPNTAPAAGHRDDVNILEPHMPDKGVKDMPEAGIEAAQHKGGCLIWPRQITGIEEDGC